MIHNEWEYCPLIIAIHKYITIYVNLSNVKLQFKNMFTVIQKVLQLHSPSTREHCAQKYSTLQKKKKVKLSIY